jgi:hypothetical protein
MVANSGELEIRWALQAGDRVIALPPWSAPRQNDAYQN